MWTTIWWLVVKEGPESDPHISPAELKYIQVLPSIYFLRTQNLSIGAMFNVITNYENNILHSNIISNLFIIFIFRTQEVLKVVLIFVTHGVPC